MEAFLVALRERYAGHVAIEPRHPTWFDPESLALLTQYRCAQVAADPKAQQDLDAYIGANPETVKNKDQWRKGGWAPEPPVKDGWDKLGVQGERARAPVFRVTVTEAYFFANWLGGKLPTKNQWIKAAGGRLDQVTNPDEDNRKGPFDGDVDDPIGLAVNLGKTGPQPVEQAKRDVSKFGCRNMSGNGQEWTRDTQGDFNRDTPDLQVPLGTNARPGPAASVRASWIEPSLVQSLSTSTSMPS